MEVPMIVLTGGPCAGKTTALARIHSWCTERGLKPLIVPEVATELIESGFDPRESRFQQLVLREILHKEELRLDEASNVSEQNPVIICDRGAVEGIAYNRVAFENACRVQSLSFVDLRDRRYAGVIFLRSAASGAEQFYTTINNTARSESLEEARLLDERTLEAWIGTPHLKEIKNFPNQDFEAKMQEVIRALARTLGVPEPIECERKFRLHEFYRSQLPEHAVDVDIVQTYLVSRPDIVERVRARGQKNNWVFFHTIKERRGSSISIERERIISSHEYDALLVRRDTSLLPIHKTRTCFAYQGLYFEVDQFHGHQEGLVLFEVELSDINDAISIPPFLSNSTDETGNEEYSNNVLARSK